MPLVDPVSHNEFGALLLSLDVEPGDFGPLAPPVLRRVAPPPIVREVEQCQHPDAVIVGCLEIGGVTCHEVCCPDCPFTDYVPVHPPRLPRADIEHCGRLG